MRVSINFSRCDANGTCVDACPEVFALEDDAEVVYLLDETPGEELRDKVMRAARLCPKAAIEVSDAP